MGLILKIAAGIVLAVLILGALAIGVPALMGSYLKGKATDAHYAQCESMGIAKEDCRKP